MNANPIKWTRTHDGLASKDGRFKILRVQNVFYGTTYTIFKLYVEGQDGATFKGKQGECKEKASEILASEASEPTVTTRNVEALPMQHAFGDTKPAARVEVLVDGVLIGYVTSDSTESYAKNRNSRLRGRFLGYTRRYLGHLDTNRFKDSPTWRNADAISSSRKHAITELVEAWQRATTN